jgi:hypothetical protein
MWCSSEAKMKFGRNSTTDKSEPHEAKEGRLPLNHHPLFQQNGRSNHRNDDHYCSHNQPVSPDSPCPRRPDIPAVASRVRLSGLSIGSLFPVAFHHVQPWSSPVPSWRLSLVVSCIPIGQSLYALRQKPLHPLIDKTTADPDHRRNVRNRHAVSQE